MTNQPSPAPSRRDAEDVPPATEPNNELETTKIGGGPAPTVRANASGQLPDGLIEALTQMVQDGVNISRADLPKIIQKWRIPTNNRNLDKAMKLVTDLSRSRLSKDKKGGNRGKPKSFAQTPSIPSIPPSSKLTKEPFPVPKEVLAYAKLTDQLPTPMIFVKPLTWEPAETLTIPRRLQTYNTIISQHGHSFPQILINAVTLANHYGPLGVPYLLKLFPPNSRFDFQEYVQAVYSLSRLPDRTNSSKADECTDYMAEMIPSLCVQLRSIKGQLKDKTIDVPTTLIEPRYLDLVGLEVKGFGELLVHNFTIFDDGVCHELTAGLAAKVSLTTGVPALDQANVTKIVVHLDKCPHDSRTLILSALENKSKSGNLEIIIQSAPTPGLRAQYGDALVEGALSKYVTGSPRIKLTLADTKLVGKNNLFGKQAGLAFIPVDPEAKDIIELSKKISWINRYFAGVVQNSDATKLAKSLLRLCNLVERSPELITSLIDPEGEQVLAESRNNAIFSLITSLFYKDSSKLMTTARQLDIPEFTERLLSDPKLLDRLEEEDKWRRNAIDLVLKGLGQ